jgi:beta-phosphoglucomutase-like phosphatase (HAD superfamily)
MGVPGNAFLFDLDGTLVDIIDSRPILQQFMSGAAVDVT